MVMSFLFTVGFTLVGGALSGMAGNKVGHYFDSTATGKRTGEVFSSVATKLANNSSLPKKA